MSSDNYYVIRKHPDGGFAAVMGFASDDETPRVNRRRHASYPTVDAAAESVSDEYTEYGISVHHECTDEATS